MKGYWVSNNERVQGDHYFWTHNFDNILNNNPLDQPEQVKETECSIMKEYKVIHNERVQGDPYLQEQWFWDKHFFIKELIGPI